MKLRILQRSVIELESILQPIDTGTPAETPRSRYAPPDGIMASVDVTIDDEAYNALPESVKRRLVDLDVRANPYQAVVRKQGEP